MTFNMSLRDYYPESFSPVTMYGRTYQILDPYKLIKDFIFYKPTLREWDIKPIYLAGLQGSGKTNFIRYFIWIICHVYRYVMNGVCVVFTNDIRVLGDETYAHIFKDHKVIILIRDDAMAEGTDSRTAMHGVTKDVTQKFVRSRHIAHELHGGTGIIFTIFATQDYNRLDPTLRKNALLKIFTSYVDEPEFHNMFPFEESRIMSDATYDGHIRSDLDARSFLMLKVISGHIATLDIPFISWETIYDLIENPLDSIKKAMNENKETRPYKVSINTIDRSIKKEEVIRELAEKLLSNEMYLELIRLHPKINSMKDFTLSQFKGYLEIEGNKIQDKKNISLRKGDYVSAINLALYIQLERDLELLKQGEAPIMSKSVKDKISDCFALRGVKILHYDDICNGTGLNKSQIAPILSQNRNEFTNIIPNKGFWSLTANLPSEREIELFIAENNIIIYKKQNKILEMPG